MFYSFNLGVLLEPHPVRGLHNPAIQVCFGEFVLCLVTTANALWCDGKWSPRKRDFVPGFQGLHTNRPRAWRIKDHEEYLGARRVLQIGIEMESKSMSKKPNLGLRTTNLLHQVEEDGEASATAEKWLGEIPNVLGGRMSSN